MSLIGLLTATEKQVCSGRLHMRPIQWHLKRHWHIPEVLEKVIPVPPSHHPHLDWWLDKTNVLKGQPLHPLRHAVQLFTDASNEGWGSHLGLHCKRHLVIHGKSPSYKLSRTEGSPPGSAIVRASVQGSDSSCCNGQHNSGLVQRGQALFVPSCGGFCPGATPEV